MSLDVTITNASSQILRGPLQLVIGNLTSGVSLTHADGIDSAGNSYLNLGHDLPGNQLQIGQSITVRLYFANPQRLRFSFDWSLFGML